MPGFSLTPAIAVGTGAAVASVMRLPLAGLVMATILTVHTGLVGAGPLIILGVVAAYLATVALADHPAAEHGSGNPVPAEQSSSTDAGLVTTKATAPPP